MNKEECKVKSYSFQLPNDSLSHKNRSVKTQSDLQLTAKATIPCLYLPYAQGSSKLMIYFHGNAEDVGLASELLDYIRSLLRVIQLKFNPDLGSCDCHGISRLWYL